MRNQMSIDWIDKEQKQQGIILRELIKVRKHNVVLYSFDTFNLKFFYFKVNSEIEISRLNGQELRFLKEKRNILLLASYQFDIEIKEF